MLLVGLLIFMLASLAAAFSPIAGFLITVRSLLTMGGAIVMPNVLAIIRHTFDDPKKRTIALGFLGTIGSDGAALGSLWGRTSRTFLVGISFPDQRADHFCRPANCLFELAALYANGKGKLDYIGQALVLIGGLIAIVYAVKSGFKVESNLLITLPDCCWQDLVCLPWFVR